MCRCLDRLKEDIRSLEAEVTGENIRSLEAEITGRCERQQILLTAEALLPSLLSDSSIASEAFFRDIANYDKCSVQASVPKLGFRG